MCRSASQLLSRTTLGTSWALARRASSLSVNSSIVSVEELLHSEHQASRLTSSFHHSITHPTCLCHVCNEEEVINSDFHLYSSALYNLAVKLTGLSIWDSTKTLPNSITFITANCAQDSVGVGSLLQRQSMSLLFHHPHRHVQQLGKDSLGMGYRDLQGPSIILSSIIPN